MKLVLFEISVINSIMPELSFSVYYFFFIFKDIWIQEEISSQYN